MFNRTLENVNRTAELAMQEKQMTNESVNELIECIVSEALVNGGVFDKKKIKAIYDEDGCVNAADRRKIDMRIEGLYRRRLAEQGGQTGASAAAHTDATTSRIGNADARFNIQGFAERIAGFDQQCNVIVKQGGGMPMWALVLLWVFLFPFMLIGKAIAVATTNAKGDNLKGPERQKADFIKQFLLPTDATDLKEFALYVQSQILDLNYIQLLTKRGVNNQMWNLVWLGKLTEVNNKLTSMSGADTVAIQEVKTVCDDCNAIVEGNKKKSYILAGAGAALAILFFIFGAATK